MLPLMVSRLPLGAGRCPAAGCDQCRRLDCRTPNLWQGGQGRWRRDPHVPVPFPARLSGGASHGRGPRPGFAGKSLPSASPDKLVTRRALTTKAHATRALRRLNVRNSSPYLEEIPIRAGCPGGTTGSPS